VGTIVLYSILLVALTPPLGAYLHRVYTRERTGRIEGLVYRLIGVDATAEHTWRRYASLVLWFSAISMGFVYVLLRLQQHLPLNPEGLPSVNPYLSFNTAASFMTNTNWQAYGGETTMSSLSQMLALTFQNFVSAAVGMAVLVAMIRGFTRAGSDTLGNFWRDTVRGTVYVLLPMAAITAVVLMSQGVIQTLGHSLSVHGIQGFDQVIARGPVASQVAIKQLGTNGGGFFNANSAHPFENPTPLANFVEAFAILWIPAALTFLFGRMVGSARQGWALFAAMWLLMVVGFAVTAPVEHGPTQAMRAAGVSASAPNLEGKEVRIGTDESALWAVVTTDASNGSVNSMHDSYQPIGQLAPMFNMAIGEVVWGGVGSGLYGMVFYVVVAVFIGGLMVGRTPEYLGKKIEAYEMKMSSLVILIVPAVVLVGTAVGVLAPAGRAGVANPGAHGFSEILYAFSSAGNNNGSAFAGLSANTPFYNTALGLAMLIGRYWLAVPVLAIAGALARKKIVPAGAGTLPTHTPLFVALLVGVVILVGALTYVPALALGPIVEHLMLVSAR